MHKRIWIVAAAALVLVLLPLAARLAKQERFPRATTPLHEAARQGQLATAQRLLDESADVNAVDEAGKTALHWAAENGHGGTVAVLLERGADPDLVDDVGNTALQYALQNGHGQTASRLRPVGVEVPAGGADTHALSPSLKYGDQAAFERAIGQPACVLTSEHVRFFAPASKQAQAETVFPYLVKAYDELYRIVGVHTEYVIVVYNFPKGHGDAFGGTSNCVLWYDDANLDLEKQEEWTRWGIPHVSGYIEEIAHNFVAATKAQFGWEMVGWSIGAKVSDLVASNPIHTQHVADTRRAQAETFQRYRDLGDVFPPDVPANLVDRIHAHLLWQCEQQYGPSFWPDFFREVRSQSTRLRDAVHLGGGNAIRDERYRITIECFDRLAGLDFKGMLQENGISLTTDIKSLAPTEAGWDRKLQ